MRVWLTLTILSLSMGLIACEFTFTSTDGGCADELTQVYSPSSLTCVACSISGTIPRTASSSNALVPDYGAGSDLCVCPPSRVAVTDPDTGVLTACTACPSGSSADPTQTVCVPCSASAANSTAGLSVGSTAAAYDAAAQSCSCAAAPGSVLVAYDGAGALLPYMECAVCSAQSQPAGQGSPYAFVCEPCSAKGAGLSRVSGTCECLGPVFVDGPEGSDCLPSSVYSELSTRFPVASASRITFSEIQNKDDDLLGPVTLASWVVGQYFPAAASYCSVGGDEAACQTLGNLCVLANYDEDAAPCAVFNEIANAQPGNVNGYDDWKEGMPWLEYGSAFTVLRSSSEISAEFTFSQDEESAGRAIYNMVYILASYTINGTLVGTTRVSDELQLCVERPVFGSRWRRFGTNLYSECVIDLYPLQQAAAAAGADSQLLLHDLYLLNTLDSTLTPVPVRLSNLRRSGQYVNVDDSEFNDVLVRRFYLTDAVTGKRSAETSADVVRIAKSLRLMVTLQDSGSGRIRPPVVDLTVTERMGASLGAVVPEDAFKEADGRPRISFESVYTMDLSDFWSSVAIGFGVVLFVAVLTWLIRLYAWIQRNQSAVGTEFLGPMLAYLFGSLGSILFWFVYAIALYWFIFFKWQATVAVLLPTNSALPQLYAVLGTAFACQILAVLYITYKQASVDVFLMDWERPKGQIVPKDGDIRNAQPASISIWRTFFIANEWHELQAVRKVSLEATLFALLFLLQGVGLEYLATPQPAFTDLTPMPPNIILKFALTTSLWLGLAGLQVLFKYAISDRFFDNAAIDFVDLLSLSNISVLVLYERYAGFYLHGRSIYQHTDVSMREMGANLMEEMEGMAPPRGLGENSDCQTFEIFVTHQFRDAFDECYGDVTNHFSLIPCAKSSGGRGGARASRRATMAAAAAAPSRLGQAAPGEPRRPRSGPSDVTLAAYARVNAFLTDFIDGHGSTAGAESSYRIESRPALSQLLQIPPDTSAGASILNPTSLTSFTKVTFYGIELSLLLLNIMVYAITDIGTGSTFIAALVTWLVERILIRIRMWMGAKNLTQKTLVDERFLV